jgi:GMP synthase-like glutamine amidotransferase
MPRTARRLCDDAVTFSGSQLFGCGQVRKIMKMAVLQHVPFEGPAAIADWAAARKIGVAVRHLYRGDPLPDLPEFDMLTVMGGPMSANDETVLPWLAPEIARVGDAIASDKIVLGVCLGAQIIAKALGAKVYKAAQKEIGWLPVRAEAAHALFEGLPAEFMALHWHGETFDLPAQAERLASTPGTANQAFAVGKKVLGLQFHMEATKESVNALIENAANDIGAGAYEQRPDAIRAGIRHCALLRTHLDRILDNLAGFPVN